MVHENSWLLGSFFNVDSICSVIEWELKILLTLIALLIWVSTALILGGFQL